MVSPSSSADYRGDDRNGRQLALIVPTDSAAAAASGGDDRRSSGFRLPEGWKVEGVRRTGSGVVDKFYYEPVTGRKFRSLRAVERHVKGKGEQLPANPLALMWGNTKKRSRCSGSSSGAGSGPATGRSRKIIIYGGKVVDYREGMRESELATLASTSAISHYNLPDGWVMEEVPRREGAHTDKYYYEPGSGQKFRSLTAAQKHVATTNEERPLAQAFRRPRSLKKRAPNMRRPSINGEQPTSSNDEPKKIKWVLGSSDLVQGDTWKVFVGDREVPDSIIRDWNEEFYMAMNTNSSAPR